MSASLPNPANSTEDIRLALRSWPEVETYLQTCKGVIIPLGSTEQHGPTGAIGTDALTAEAIALEVGRRTGVLVTPAQAFGMASAVNASVPMAPVGPCCSVDPRGIITPLPRPTAQQQVAASLHRHTCAVVSQIGLWQAQ